MTDKVQKIKDWISKTQDGLMNAQGNFENPSEEGAFHILSNLDYYIDSMQEEPVSEGLEKAADKYAEENYPDEPSFGQFGTGDYEPYVDMSAQREVAKEDFKAGSEWKEEQMMAKAVDGVVTFDYYGWDKAYGCVAHDSFCLEDLGLKDMDEVKILILKK